MKLRKVGRGPKYKDLICYCENSEDVRETAGDVDMGRSQMSLWKDCPERLQGGCRHLRGDVGHEHGPH